MPVTKKKGAIFAIYADSPDRAAPSTTSSSSSSSAAASSSTSKAKLVKGSSGTGTSPTKRSSTQRKALSSLQPRAITSTSTTSLRSTGKYDINTLKQTKNDFVVDGKVDQLKSKSKSKLQIFSDDAPLGTTKTSTKHTSSRKLQPLSLSQSTLSTKRTRDLLSPLPIDPAPRVRTKDQDSLQKEDGTSTRQSQNQSQRATNGESPLKRNRTTPSTTHLHLSPAAAAAAAAGGGVFDKENVPPSDGSPATRTRSRTSSLASSTTTITLSPLRFTNTTPQQRRVESLLGDGRGTLTLKKGRELARIMDSETFGMTTTTVFASTEEKSTGPKGKGLGVKADGALVDVSEAYGAGGDEPEGFKTQRR
nr:uncharacterized protein CI109_006242 [Kwoniella shandongensis]KAA5525438.1 hypothetical protein CI109_006242 [Kwoniella shandongensis]